MTPGNSTVLVIDDDHLNLKLVEALLEKTEYSLLQAESAEDGIQLARNHRPFLILMDIQLPGTDGITATRMIKGDKALRGIPIVAFTAYAMQDIIEKALKAGCSGHIIKPFNSREFYTMIEQHRTSDDKSTDHEEETS